ncbi:unnamed protein product [Clonostachys solani]|uniref:Uncharacterized protein n=1 Tax=Clonostachys solani TaxID=160281 RepID=A0A9N9Z6Q9_9HYPO|nr:unnamed protein product [Clonostachys solani]
MDNLELTSTGGGGVAIVSGVGIGDVLTEALVPEETDVDIALGLIESLAKLNEKRPDSAAGSAAVSIRIPVLLKGRPNLEFIAKGWVQVATTPAEVWEGRRTVVPKGSERCGSGGLGPGANGKRYIANTLYICARIMCGFASLVDTKAFHTTVIIGAAYARVLLRNTFIVNTHLALSVHTAVARTTAYTGRAAGCGIVSNGGAGDSAGRCI